MNILKQLEKFVKGNTLLAFVGVLVLLMAMRQFSRRKYSETDSMTTQSLQYSDVPQAMSPDMGDGVPVPAAPTSNSAADLLPSGTNNNQGPNLLKAGSAIGMVSQCSKNPNLQIRAEPPNPRGPAPSSESVIAQNQSSGIALGT